MEHVAQSSPFVERFEHWRREGEGASEGLRNYGKGKGTRGCQENEQTRTKVDSLQGHPGTVTRFRQLVRWMHKRP